MRSEMADDPDNSCCTLFGQFDHVCEGRITWEHAIIAGGKRVQKKWAIIPLCAKAHAVDNFQDAGTMKKELNEWIALSRATDEDLLDLFGEIELSPFSKANIIFQRRKFLISKYGKYTRKFPLPGLRRKEDQPTPDAIILTTEERDLLRRAKEFCFKNEGIRYNDRTMLKEALRSFVSGLEKMENE
jgi:hypothetical protein